jgi:hypothetical protein
MHEYRLALFLCIAFAAGTLRVYAQEVGTHHIELPAGSSVFNPKTAQDVTTHFQGGVVATFKASSPIKVVIESTEGPKTIALPAEFAQFTSARLFRSDRLVITGMISGDVWEVVIVNPEKGTVIDHFWCYLPAISPSGRYVMFVKFYGPHFVESVEDHEMLYDVKLSPEQNRPRGAKSHLFEVGKVVFPSGIENQPGDNEDLGDRPVHMMASRGFFWNDDSNEVIFADQFRDDYAVVAVNIVDGAHEVESVPIPKQWICPDVTPCYVDLARVNFGTPPALGFNVVFRGVLGTPAKESHMAISRNAAGHLAVTSGK